MTCSNATDSPQSARPEAECHRRKNWTGNPFHSCVETWASSPALRIDYSASDVYCCAFLSIFTTTSTNTFGCFFLRLTIVHNKRLRTAQRNLSSISSPGEQRPSAPAPAVKIRRNALGGGQHCDSCPLRLVPSVESAAQSSAAGLLVRNASCNTTFWSMGTFGWYKVAFAF